MTNTVLTHAFAALSLNPPLPPPAQAQPSPQVIQTTAAQPAIVRCNSNCFKPRDDPFADVPDGKYVDSVFGAYGVVRNP